VGLTSRILQVQRAADLCLTLAEDLVSLRSPDPVHLWLPQLISRRMSNLHRTDRANAHCAAQETASNSLDKTMSAGEMQKGISLLKEGDSTPVSAADFAIQGLVSEALQKSFPHDRFMGEAAARSAPSYVQRPLGLGDGAGAAAHGGAASG
jgi:hypothetical protein